MNNLFHSFFNLIIALLLLVAGICGMLIPWSAEFRTHLIQFLLEGSTMVSLFGAAFILLALAIIVSIFIGRKQRYYYIKAVDRTIKIDKAIFQQYLQLYWQELFPEDKILNTFNIKNNQIYISVDLPCISATQQPLLLKRIEYDLQEKFMSLLGYHHEFHLAVSFKNC